MRVQIYSASFEGVALDFRWNTCVLAVLIKKFKFLNYAQRLMLFVAVCVFKEVLPKWIRVYTLQSCDVSFVKSIATRICRILELF